MIWMNLTGMMLLGGKKKFGKETSGNMGFFGDEASATVFVGFGEVTAGDVTVCSYVQVSQV